MKNSKTFPNLLVSDFYKASKLKGTYIAILIMILLLAINFAASYVLINKVDDAESVTGKDFLFSSLSSANIGLFIAIISGLFIGKEFSDGTMRLIIARGIKRSQIYFSKLTVLIILIIIYGIISLIIGGIFTAILGYSEPFSGLQFALILRMFSLEILALISSASIFTMLAFLFRSSGSTIGAAVGFYLIITILASVLSTIASSYKISDPSKSNILFEITYYLPYQQSGIATSHDTISTSHIVAAIVMPIVYTAISSIIGCISFIKRDVK